MAKELEKQAQAHVVKVPDYLLNGAQLRPNSLSFKLSRISGALKLLARDQGLEYTLEEWQREFGDAAKCRVILTAQLKKDHLRLRMVTVDGKILLFANESNKK